MNDIIEAISCEKEIIQLKLLNVPKHPKMIAKIFSILKDEEINVDMISQVTVDDFVQIEITLDQEFQLKLNQAIMKLKDEFKKLFKMIKELVFRGDVDGIFNCGVVLRQEKVPVKLKYFI